MSRPNQTSVRNQLLASLPADDYALMQPHLEAVTLDRGAVLIEPMQQIPYAWFPDSGLGSIVAISPEGHKSEMGVVGRDGVICPALLLGIDRTPQQALIQAAGAGHRIAADELRRLMRENLSLREALLRYVYVFGVQTSHTALSNAEHTVEERLARWLLMCHDRSDDALDLTHEFIALMLAVRRPSVTTALHILEGMHLIRNSRGSTVILDRAGLEALAADAYGIPETEYERVIGPLRKRVPVGEQGEESDGSVVPFKRDKPKD